MAYQLNHRYWDSNLNKEVFYNGVDNVDAFGFTASYQMFGTTENRPNPKSIEKGFRYFDTTLNKPVWWNGEKWVNSMGINSDSDSWVTIE